MAEEPGTPAPVAPTNGKSYAVHPKVGAGAAGGALAALIVWGIGTGLKISIPAEVAASVTTVVSFVLAYFMPGE